MNRFLVTIVARDGGINTAKVTERLKKIGEVRSAVADHNDVKCALLFLRTLVNGQGVAAELRGTSPDPHKPKALPVIGDKDEVLLIDVGENTLLPSEGIRMWLFRK